MINKFKKRPYKITAAVALGCLVCIAGTTTNGVNAKALDIENLQVMHNSVQYDKNEKPKFLVDSKIKHYDDIYKTQKVAGFEFKLPDYTDNTLVKEPSVSIEKITDDNNVVKIFFDNFNDDRNMKNYEMIISEYDPIEVLKEINKYGNGNDNTKVEKQQHSINGINGDIVTVTVNIPEEKNDDYVINAEEDIYKYFVWNENGINYCIEFSSEYREDNDITTDVKLSEDDIYTVLNSLKNIDDISNINYNGEKEKELSAGVAVMPIYDEEDLNKAKSIIGFNPKFPVNINNNIKASQSSVNINPDSDIENGKIKYNLWTRYEFADTSKETFITFISSEENDIYDEIKNKGYYTREKYDYKADESSSVNISAEKISLGGRQVYKSQEDDGDYRTVNYLWQEDGIYYELIFWNTENVDLDSLAQVFISSEEYR